MERTCRLAKLRIHHQMYRKQGRTISRLLLNIKLKTERYSSICRKLYGTKWLSKARMSCFSGVAWWESLLSLRCQITDDDVTCPIMASASEWCGLDPLPRWLLEECTTGLDPIKISITNASLKESYVPDSTKKNRLLFVAFKNYRIKLNFKFISEKTWKGNGQQIRWPSDC